ncbi:XRE family transcriptional regulator [Morganella psychrotolerans]|uniref:Repressor n=1 Tax=Morganella psychrotolerans TaxID=368603 RepID=A0A1B8HQG9_9GAMM|nr:helix-turn-helix transcriptional regulator [Morganella psychrotolerans]OBU11511.1 repressor [Morganella psychrotolerans]
MKTFSDRLNFAMQQAGVSQADLALAVGVAQPTIWKLTAGKSQTSRKSMEIAAFLGVNPVWLTTGVGEPFGNQERASISNAGDPIPVTTWDSSTPLEDDEVEVPFLRDIEFACGNGSYNEDDYNGFKLRFSKSTLRKIGANTDGSDVICFPARGNSMEPVIPDGSTVGVVISDKRVIDGKMYAINQGGWKRLKILYRSGPDTITIRSFNTDEYPDETAAMSDVEIIGRVFWYSVMA